MSEVISYSPVKTECNVSVENNDENSINKLEENNYVEEDYTYVESSLYNSYDTISDFGSVVHPCNICDNYETLNETNLASHLAICQGTEQHNENNLQINRKLYVCDICNKQFTNSTNISRHKRRHTGNRSYECKICLKRFFRKDHLSVHFIKIHRKSFHCTICNIGFQQQELIIAHIQNVHDSQFVMNKSCPLCKFSSNSVINLRIHIFNRHDIDPINSNIPDIDVDVINNTKSTTQIQIYSNNGNLNNSGDCNDIKESIRENRSESNATPPMNFLTPYVEISMVDPTANKHSSASFSQTNYNNTGSEKHVPKDIDSQYIERPYFPQSSRDMSFIQILPENNYICEISTITPYDSSDPLKQDQKQKSSRQSGSINNHNRGTEYDHFQSSFSSLIKTSPLETLVHNEFKQCDSIINIPNPFQVQQNNTYSNQWSNKIYKNSKQCSFCDIIFPDQKLYSVHNMCHSESNPWKCNFCGQQCSNVYEFNFHLLTKDHQ